MKYTDETKNAVQTKTHIVPRGHRLWQQLGIDKAEDSDAIELWQTQDEKAEALKNEARAWRDSELLKADIEIHKLEDAGNDAGNFRAYRIALRDWPATDGFPESGKPEL